MIIEKKYHFYAAHRNKEAGEKCGRIHGHTYFVNCFFDVSSMSSKGGVTILFSDIDDLVEPIVKQYDHYLLLYEEDDLCSVLEKSKEPFIKMPFETSVENMVKWLFTEIKSTDLPIVKISLQETTSSIIIYGTDQYT